MHTHTHRHTHTHTHMCVVTHQLYSVSYHHYSLYCHCFVVGWCVGVWVGVCVCVCVCVSVCLCVSVCVLSSCRRRGSCPRYPMASQTLKLNCYYSRSSNC